MFFNNPFDFIAKIWALILNLLSTDKQSFKMENERDLKN